MRRSRFFVSFLFLLVLSCAVRIFEQPKFARAQAMDAPSSSSEENQPLKVQIDAIQSQVDSKRSKIKDLEALIGKYKTKISQQESKQVSLSNQVLLLEDRIAKKGLDVERAQTEIEALQLEIQSLEDRISEASARMQRQKEDAAELVRQIHQADDVLPLEVFLTKKSLSAFFDRLEEIKSLQRSLADALQKAKTAKQQFEQTKKEQDEKRQTVEANRKTLMQEKLAFEAEKNLKASLILETKSQQSEFERALYELKEQQQSTTDDIATLESKLKDKLNAVDESLARGDVLLNWPVDPSRGITATFHDPTYPFKNLFPHPGVDVRASVGTNVKSAAGGYVAWNKQGRLYGNYTMVVHPGNIATVYAHLSRFIAKPDSYVERGDVIGQSGGMPGQPGAGLSTGPHLHFEVRQNGIPVDPENFLPSTD